jgi:hypothetical protein
MLKRWALLCGLMLAATSASATTVTYQITVVIDTITLSGGPYVPVSGPQAGDSLTAILSIDLSQAALQTGSYYALYVASLEIPAQGWSTTNQGLQIIDDQFGVDQFATPVSFLGTNGGALDGNALTGIGMTLSDYDQVVFNSVALQVPVDVAPFEQNSFGVGFGGVSINGHVTQIQLVPEPRLTALIGAGVLAIACARRVTR